MQIVNLRPARRIVNITTLQERLPPIPPLTALLNRPPYTRRLRTKRFFRQVRCLEPDQAPIQLRSTLSKKTTQSVGSMAKPLMTTTTLCNSIRTRMEPCQRAAERLPQTGLSEQHIAWHRVRDTTLILLAIARTHTMSVAPLCCLDFPCTQIVLLHTAYTMTSTFRSTLTDRTCFPTICQSQPQRTAAIARQWLLISRSSI